MAGTTRVNGVDYMVSAGKAMVSGTGYLIQGGKAMAGGTVYSIIFSGECEVSLIFGDVPEEDVNIYVNGAEHPAEGETFPKTYHEQVSAGDTVEIGFNGNQQGGTIYVNGEEDSSIAKNAEDSFLYQIFGDTEITVTGVSGEAGWVYSVYIVGNVVNVTPEPPEEETPEEET